MALDPAATSAVWGEGWGVARPRAGTPSAAPSTARSARPPGERSARLLPGLGAGAGMSSGGGWSWPLLSRAKGGCWIQGAQARRARLALGVGQQTASPMARAATGVWTAPAAGSRALGAASAWRSAQARRLTRHGRLAARAFASAGRIRPVAGARLHGTVAGCAIGLDEGREPRP
jgi:hypothetical protein